VCASATADSTCCAAPRKWCPVIANHPFKMNVKAASERDAVAACRLRMLVTPWRVTGLARGKGHTRRDRALRSCEMSGEKPGWRAHPDAKVRANLPPVEPGRVVGLGAICDLDPRTPDKARSQSFSVSEFVTLEDGRRVILHEDRGFTIGLGSSRETTADLRRGLTLEVLTRQALNVVLPDDDVPAEAHPYSWLADLARARGLNVTADDLRSLPYEVTFTDEVRRWLAPA
jgi:hypothetical protein